jgi:uncharacterized protein
MDHSIQFGRVQQFLHWRFHRHAQIVIGILWFLISFILFPSHVLGVTYPETTGYVNDFADMLSPATEAALDQRVRGYEQETGNEIAVATIRTLEGELLEDYAVRLFEKWKPGKADKDNGVLFLIVKDDRKLRIEVGYGLEPVLTDGEAGSIIRNVVTPKFKESKYDEGVSDGVEAIISGIGSAENGLDQVVGNNPVRNLAGSKIDTLFQQFGEFLFVIPAFGIYLFSFMSRTKDIILGAVIGAIGGGLVGLLFGSTTVLAVLGVGGAIFGLILDWILSSNYQKLSRSGRSTDWFHSYGGFGGSRSSGGSGGFGGGSSGGGGGSGSW